MNRNFMVDCNDSNANNNNNNSSPLIINNNPNGIKASYYQQTMSSFGRRLRMNSPNIFSNLSTAVHKRSFSEAYYKSLDVQKRPRLVKKCGELNIHMENVAKHKRRLLRDLFNTILG